MFEYFEGAQQGRRIEGRPDESREDWRWRRDWKFWCLQWKNSNSNFYLFASPEEESDHWADDILVDTGLCSGKRQTPLVGKWTRNPRVSWTIKVKNEAFFWKFSHSFKSIVLLPSPDVDLHWPGAALACTFLHSCVSLLPPWRMAEDTGYLLRWSFRLK